MTVTFTFRGESAPHVVKMRQLPGEEVVDVIARAVRKLKGPRAKWCNVASMPASYGQIIRWLGRTRRDHTTNQLGHEVVAQGWVSCG